MFRTLIAGGRFDKETGKIRVVDPPLAFSDILYPIIKEHLVSWATGPSSFVPLALLEAGDFTHTAELKDTMIKSKSTLQQAAEAEVPSQRLERGAAKHDTVGKAGPNGKKTGSKHERPIGNAGTRLLLGKL